jgi:predicted nucleic acid-binding protein
MGLILDSSLLIAAERKGRNARQTLTEISAGAAGEDVAVSVVTLIAGARCGPRQYAGEKGHATAVSERTDYGFAGASCDGSYGFAGGQIDGENTALGVRLALSDLLIGVTALELGYRVATANFRHFQMVPGLEIFSL